LKGIKEKENLRKKKGETQQDPHIPEKIKRLDRNIRPRRRKRNESGTS
jgi:hypothetical protein